MSKPRRFAAARGRDDANQREITSALEAVGCGVIDMSSLGKGIADLLACRIQPGGRVQYFLIEVKVEKGKLRPAQAAFARRWPDVVSVIRSADEAVALVLKGIQS